MVSVFIQPDCLSNTNNNGNITRNFLSVLKTKLLEVILFFIVGTDMVRYNLNVYKFFYEKR